MESPDQDSPRDGGRPPVRLGHCLGCGQHCCTSVVIPFTKVMSAHFLAHEPIWVEPSQDPDYDRWLALHGIAGGKVWMLPAFTRYSVIGSGTGRVPIATIPLPCHALNGDGSCSLYDSPDRPQLCADWPFEPLQLQTMSVEGQAACGYSFSNDR